jgi:hypothetical protein
MAPPSELAESSGVPASSPPAPLSTSPASKLSESIALESKPSESVAAPDVSKDTAVSVVNADFDASSTALVEVSSIGTMDGSCGSLSTGAAPPQATRAITAVEKTSP